MSHKFGEYVKTIDKQGKSYVERKLKHTQGPWIKDYGKTVGHIKSVISEANEYTPTICRYKNNNDRDIVVAYSLSDEEVEANGLLISAAPEMLEALINLVKFCEHDFIKNFEPEIKNIIEKATGMKIKEVLDV